MQGAGPPTGAFFADVASFATVRGWGAISAFVNSSSSHGHPLSREILARWFLAAGCLALLI
jgi:hypothetical protein